MKYFYANLVVMLLCLSTSCSNDFEEDNEPIDDESTKYELTLSVYPSNSGKVFGADTLTQPSTVEIKATPNEGYTFKHWKINSSGKVLSIEPVYLLELNKSIDLIAVFEKERLNLLIAPSEQKEMDIFINFEGNVPKNKTVLVARYLGSDFLLNGISQDNSGVVNDNGNVHMVINTKDLDKRDLYRNITGGGPHIWLSKTFGPGGNVYPWAENGQYLRLKVDASVPFVLLEDANGNTSNTNFPANKAPVTQLSFGLYIRDQQSKTTFAYIVCFYESRGTYRETANANDTFVDFVSTPVETSSKFITVPSSSAVLQSVPFSDKKSFEVFIKKENLENVIRASKASLSTDLSKYELTSSGIMFELPNYVANGHNTSVAMLSNFEVSLERE